VTKEGAVQFRNGATDVILPHTLFAMLSRAASSPGQTPFAHASMVGDVLHACNPAFCVYSAVASAMMLQAWLDLRWHQPDQAREHALHGMACVLLALVHWLG
jgi:hypothetical protein